ncbi:hypothetical protein pb186bvf_001912 [Paramecium bursaria]
MQSRLSTQNNNYRVHLRLKPVDYQQKMIDINGEQVNIKDPSNKSSDKQQYQFASICQTQEQSFRIVEPMLQKLIEGHNSCVLSYGQTGSGKSYTIFGSDLGDPSNDKRGILPRAMEYLLQKAQEFDEIREFVITGTFVEVYLDQVRDLCRNGNMISAFENENLTIYENTNGQIMVKDVTQVNLRTIADLQDMLTQGLQLREKLDQQSSYSAKAHSVFTLNLVQKDKENENLPFMNATLQFVDLAGSERIAKSLTEGHKFQEAILVNSSLTALGKCLAAVSQMNSKNIPYRESKLTRILQNCLNSQSQVALIVNVNPNENNFEECLSTFQYAERTKGTQITKQHVDEQLGSPTPFPGQDKLIKKLNDEIAELKSKLEFMSKEHKSKMTEIQTLLGIDIDLDKLFSKAYAKELNHFKMQKDAAQKLEQYQIQLSEQELRIEKQKAEIQQLKAEIQTQQERLGSQKIIYEERIKKLTEQNQIDKLELEKTKQQSQEKLQSTLTVQLQKNQQQLEQKVSIIMNLPQMIQNKTNEVQKSDEIKRVAKLEVEKEYKSQIEKLTKDSKSLLDAAKEQYEFYLKEKNNEIDNFIKQFKKYQEKKKNQTKEMKQELFELYDVIQKAFRVIDKIENGAYSSGIRSFNIPFQDKPQIPSRNKFKTLFKYLDQRSMKTKKMFSDNFIITKADVADLTINIQKLDASVLVPYAQKLKDDLQQALSREKELQKRVEALEQIQRDVDLVTLIKERDEYKNLYLHESRKVISKRLPSSQSNFQIRPMTQQSRVRQI